MATIKQKLVASKIVENGGNMGQAMVAAGYSPATAKTPKKLTQSKGWTELMKEFLPDNDLLKIHKELLESYKLEVCQFPKQESDEGIRKIIRRVPSWKLITIEAREKCKICMIAIPDNLARKGALELAYKVTNKLFISKGTIGGEMEEAAEDAIAYIRKTLPRSVQ